MEEVVSQRQSANPVYPRGAATSQNFLINAQSRRSLELQYIETDLPGQVCADTFGNLQYFAVEDLMGSFRGKAIPENGKPIFAMPSSKAKGISKITPYLKHGTGGKLLPGSMLSLYPRKMVSLISLKKPKKKSQGANIPCTSCA